MVICQNKKASESEYATGRQERGILSNKGPTEMVET